jgi:membrane fusion protein, multidrug efflux system
LKGTKTLLVVCLALAACKGKPPEDEKEASAPVPVEVSFATRGDISTSILSTTVIDSEVKVDVYPKHAGPIVSLKAEEGDWVQPGQLLAQIDSAEHQLRVKQASATYEELKTAFARLETMHKNRMTSQEAFEAAKFAHEKAKITLEIAQLELSHTRIESPIRGLILQRGLRYGERVTPATLAYSIMDMEARVAEVHLPESQIARVRAGAAAEIYSDGHPGRAFRGSVRKVSPAVDPRSGTVKVTVDLKDPEMLLRPGMFVRVNIIVDTHVDTVLVRRSSVLTVDNQLAVFVVRPAPPAPETEAAAPSEAAARPEERARADKRARHGTAQAAELPAAAEARAPAEVVERVFFQPGYQNEQYVEALSGIEPGDRLVSVGQQGLQPGARVSVVGGQSAGAESGSAAP